LGGEQVGAGGGAGEEQGITGLQSGDSGVDGGGVVSGAVAGGAEVQDVEDGAAAAIGDVDGDGGRGGETGGIGGAGGEGVGGVGERAGIKAEGPVGGAGGRGEGAAVDLQLDGAQAHGIGGRAGDSDGSGNGSPVAGEGNAHRRRCGGHTSTGDGESSRGVGGIADQGETTRHAAGGSWSKGHVEVGALPRAQSQRERQPASREPLTGGGILRNGQVGGAGVGQLNGLRAGGAGDHIPEIDAPRR